MKKINKKLYSAIILTGISRPLYANEEVGSTPPTPDAQSADISNDHAPVAATEVAPQKGWRLDHVELKGIFLPTVWLLGFLVVIFIILKYFIYLPDEKRKDLE